MTCQEAQDFAANLLLDDAQASIEKTANQEVGGFSISSKGAMPTSHASVLL
jgi:hypothetical protein